MWEEGKGNSNWSDQDGVVCGSDYPVMKQTCSLGLFLTRIFKVPQPVGVLATSGGSGGGRGGGGRREEGEKSVTMSLGTPTVMGEVCV